MYNRYIPQSDGSYRKNRMQDQRTSPPQRQETAPPSRRPAESPPCPPPEPQHTSTPQPHSQTGGSVGGFLRQLLPKDFDTGDLFVVLLLLLMAADCEEEHNTALLTLALYLFM